jgi:hypothetical protein
MAASRCNKVLIEEKNIDEARTANSGLAKGGVSCFVETFVQARTVVLPMNFCAKNPALRQAANRYAATLLDRSPNRHF